MWADFSLKDLGEPFRMWYIYADYSKKQTKEHERLLKLYRRAKNRKKTHSIIKAWRHLVSVAGFLFVLGWALLSAAWHVETRQQPSTVPRVGHLCISIETFRPIGSRGDIGEGESESSGRARGAGLRST